VNLSTRVIIEATRVLTDELQINKAKAKALIGNAKDVCPGVLFCDIIAVLTRVFTVDGTGYAGTTRLFRALRRSHA
jgi:hypothetical protein